MAGIGFELQRILKEGGIGSFLKVALTGMIIVAGPWLITILGLFIISRLAGYVLAEGYIVFTGAIVYSYAFSLFIFGGLHYVFTRYVADLIFEKRERQACSALIIFSLFIFILSTLVAGAAVLICGIEDKAISYPLIFKLSATFFFGIINVLWLIMIFISMLKRYIAIFVCFVSGMILSVAGVIVLGHMLGTGGAMLGFTIGQAVSCILLFGLILFDFKPIQFRWVLKTFIKYFSQFKFLLLTGIFYYWGIWIDKLIYWYLHGTTVKGTFFTLFEYYDIPVYIANLSMIPGLIYFVVICETNFYFHLKEFLRALSKSIYQRIAEKMKNLKINLMKGLGEQILFQGIVTFLLMAFAGQISYYLFENMVEPALLRMVFLAVFFHFIYLTTMTFLFYFEAYSFAFFCSLTFFILNLSLSIIIKAPGLSYLISGLTAFMIAFFLLWTTVNQTDKKIFTKYIK